LFFVLSIIVVLVQCFLLTNFCAAFSEQSLYCWSEWLEDGYRFFLLAEAQDAPKYVLVCIVYTNTFSKLNMFLSNRDL